MQVTIQGKIFPNEEQKVKIDRLMRLQSSVMRYSYNRICEDRTKSEIEQDLKDKFPQINSRYRRGGYFRARDNYKSARELVEAGNLESEKRIVFGGRRNLKRREKGEITNKHWKRLRNKQLFSRGDKSKGGNLNLRFVERNHKLQLRVNTGDYSWLYIPAYVAKYKKRLLEGKKPYGVRIIREGGEYKLRVNMEKEYEKKINYENGAVGIDFNHSTIDLAVTNKQGQLKDTKTIDCPELTCSRKKKREWLLGNFVKKVIDYAKYWKRGIIIENLSDLTPNQSNTHMFTHRKFLKAVERRAEREGIASKKINPALTSVIGKYKYSPYYHITIHQAAALVVARRGQGFSEHLRGLKTPLLEALEAGEKGESVPDHQVHSWSLWRLMKDLPSRKGMSRKHSYQSSSGVESRRTIGSAERRPGPGVDGTPGRETAIPGSGPSIDVKSS